MDGVESNCHGNANTTKSAHSPCPWGGGGNKPQMRPMAAGDRLGMGVGRHKTPITYSKRLASVAMEARTTELGAAASATDGVPRATLARNATNRPCPTH
eukprot:11208113-Lingulodinium_polyedra.AAC.1